MNDPVFKSEVHYQDHTDVLTHKVTQPTEGLILSRNSELRKNPGALKDLGGKSPWGRQVASIPMILYEKALRDGYDLNSTDKQVAAREMNRYLQSVEGRACLVQG